MPGHQADKAAMHSALTQLAEQDPLNRKEYLLHVSRGVPGA